MADQSISEHSNAEQQSVTVAVSADRNHLRAITRNLTLSPELVPGATEKSGIAAAEGLRKRRGIHKAQHQHLAAVNILKHCRHQAVHLVEIKFGHVCSLLPQK